MKKIIWGYVFLLASITTHAYESHFRYHVYREPRGFNQVLYSVIKEDLSLRNNQSRVSQDVIFKKISHPEDSTILDQALIADQNNDNKAIVRTAAAALAPLWMPVKNTWSTQDEVNYKVWFIENASANFFAASNFTGDCADLGLLFRWAYAHDKKLPIANTLTGSGKLFGHFSTSPSWSGLATHADWKKDARFRAAMKYLMTNSYTKTVYDDLYPTLINSTYVHPGSVYMIIGSVSRTQNIYKSTSSEIRTYWGNHPATAKIYESSLMWNPSTKNRFGSWRWPILVNGVWKLVAGSQMPGYSEEQYSKRRELGETAFRAWVLGRL